MAKSQFENYSELPSAMTPNLLQKAFVKALDGVQKVELSQDEMKIRVTAKDLAEWVVLQAWSYARYQESPHNTRNTAWIEVGRRSMKRLRDERLISVVDFERFMERLESELEASQRGVHWEALAGERAGLSAAEIVCIDLRECRNIHHVEYVLRRARFQPSSESVRTSWGQMLAGAIATRAAERVATRRYATARRDWLAYTEKTLHPLTEEGVSPVAIRRFLKALKAYVEKANGPGEVSTRDLAELNERLQSQALALVPTERDVHLVRVDQGFQQGKRVGAYLASARTAQGTTADRGAARAWLEVARATLPPLLQRSDAAKVLANGLIQLAAEAQRAQADLENPQHEDRGGVAGAVSPSN
jgi:hypothetical protein